VTVAIRRTNIGQNPNEPSLLEALPPSRFTILPNTAGCYNAEDAVKGYAKLRKLAPSLKHIVPGHDPKVLERYPSPNAALKGWVARLDVEPSA